MRTTAVDLEGHDDHADRQPATGEPALQRVGDVIDDKYALEAKLGEGGTGVVWRARHLQMQSPVALKILLPRLRERGRALDRFWQEARLMGELGHPNIVRVLDVSPLTAPVPYMAMELLTGGCLYRRCKEVGRLEVHEACRLLDGVLSALVAAHKRGIVHRDIKPENLMFAEVRDIVTDERRTELKILDFGASILMAGDALSEGEGLLGTPYYMSPEQAQGALELDHRSDLYSAAVVLYELLSGHLPHVGNGVHALVYSIAMEEATPIARWRPELPPAFHEFFRVALAMDPDARFQSAEAMREALRRLSGGLSRLNRHTQLYLAAVDASPLERDVVVRRPRARSSRPRMVSSRAATPREGSSASMTARQSAHSASTLSAAHSTLAAAMTMSGSMADVVAGESSSRVGLLFAAAVLGLIPAVAVQQLSRAYGLAASLGPWRAAALTWLATALLVVLVGRVWTRRRA